MDIKTIVDISANIIRAGAIILGAVWAYFKLIRHRTLKPRLEFECQFVLTQIANDCRAIIIDQTGLDVFRRQDDARKRFGKDPVGTLTALGAKFGPSRRIDTVYRIRASCNEIDADGAVTTIGYPIIIKEQ